MIRFGTAAALLACALTTGCMSMDDEGMEPASATAVRVGGAAMYSVRTIAGNAVNSPIHTTLVAAVKAAGLVATLDGAGPFTVFAPTDDAFARLPAGTVDALLRPANKAMLTTVLSYHVVPGRMSAADLMAAIRAGGGSARLPTVNGATLTAAMIGDRIMLTDAKGGVSHVTQADVVQSNGVIHVTDAVSIPG